MKRPPVSVEDRLTFGLLALILVVLFLLSVYGLIPRHLGAP